MQGDGNLVLYDQSGAVWSTRSANSGANRCIMQTDSNLVLYDSRNNAVWSSGTCCNPGGELILQNDRNLVIYRNNVAIWASGTVASCINLHLKILTPPLRFTINQMIESMRQVYASRGFWVNVLSRQNLDLPSLNTCDVGTCFMGSVTAEQTQLFQNRNNVGNLDIVVYFVLSTNPPFNGCAAHPLGRPGCVVTRGASIWTLGHEVGHVLGLSHINNNDRLMTGNGTDRITNPPPDLIASEKNTMDSSNLTVICR